MALRLDQSAKSRSSLSQKTATRRLVSQSAHVTAIIGCDILFLLTIEHSVSCAGLGHEERRACLRGSRTPPCAGPLPVIQSAAKDLGTKGWPLFRPEILRCALDDRGGRSLQANVAGVLNILSQATGWKPVLQRRESTRSDIDPSLALKMTSTTFARVNGFALPNTVFREL